MVYCLTNEVFGLQIMKIYPFAKGFIYENRISYFDVSTKNETWFPWRSTVRSNSLGYMFLKDVRN